MKRKLIILTDPKGVACDGKLTRIDERAIVKKTSDAVSALFRQ
jgi:hypothetical protein